MSGQALKWFIFRDHLEDREFWEVGGAMTLGEAQAWKFNSEHAQPREEMIPFRLYDDDGELYYSGWTNLGDQGEADCFAPLDWAGPYAGCTEMQILQDGKWVTL
jgi:hypothetical protein